MSFKAESQFLASLAKRPTKSVQSGCSIIIFVIIIVMCYHMYIGILVTLLKGASSYVAYILAYSPHRCTLNNLGILHICGIKGTCLLLAHM